MTVTVRVRSLVWFSTGALLAFVATLLLMQAWQADAAPGDDDATLVPIDPCRVVDQRESAPTGSGGIATQQITGTNGDCTIPDDAVAVSLNVTIARPTASSYLTVYPANLTAPPTASNLNWTATSSPTPNKVDVRLSPDGAIKFYNDAGQVFVIADIVGYYTDSSLEQLHQDLVEAESRISTLEKAAPFTVTGYERGALELSATPEMIVETSLTAPVDGHVTVVYSTSTYNSEPGGIVECAPFRSAETKPATINGNVEGMGEHHSGEIAVFGSIAGTRVFPVSAGERATFEMACAEGGGVGIVAGSTIAATFTSAR